MSWWGFVQLGFVHLPYNRHDGGYNRHAADIIYTCVSKLKAGKSDGDQGFDSDHLLSGTRKLYYMFSLLFNCMSVHGHTANDLLYSNIVSIPKNLRASLSSSDNYRDIALCCSLCKVLDLVILEQYGQYLNTSDLQFGFKQGHSTTPSTVIYMETVNYFVQRHCDVFSCLLDASKAFNKVHYGKLFKLLIKRNVPLVIVRLLLDIIAIPVNKYLSLGTPVNRVTST